MCSTWCAHLGARVLGNVHADLGAQPWGHAHLGTLPGFSRAPRCAPLVLARNWVCVAWPHAAMSVLPLVHTALCSLSWACTYQGVLPQACALSDVRGLGAYDMAA